MQFTVIMTDVSVRKKAEDALSMSEEKFKAIANMRQAGKLVQSRMENCYG